jgi:hypothetical protein
MNARPICCFAFAFALAGLTRVQEPDSGAVDRTAAPSMPQRFGPIDAAMHAGMQGIWKIEKIRWGPELYQGQDLTGFMLIDEGHLAFELHARAYDDFGGEVLIYQSEVARYHFNPVGEIVLTTLIGSDNLEPGEVVTSAPPGQTRNYRVRLAGDVLLLDAQERQVSLRRMPAPKPPFYERQEPAENAAAEGAGGTEEE